MGDTQDREMIVIFIKLVFKKKISSFKKIINLASMPVRCSMTRGASLGCMFRVQVSGCMFRIRVQI